MRHYRSYCVYALSANRLRRVIVQIDIKGASIQTPIKVEPIYMKLDKRMMENIVAMFLELKEHVEQNECRLYMLILKAMFGCIEASALWYDLIRKFLEDRKGMK
jgi:hypothetical protein